MLLSIATAIKFNSVLHILFAHGNCYSKLSLPRYTLSVLIRIAYIPQSITKKKLFIPMKMPGCAGHDEYLPNW